VGDKLIVEFRLGRVIRWLALMAAVVIFIPWLGMIGIGVTLVFQGEVDLLSLITALPFTLVAGGFGYFACYLWFYRIAVYRDSLVQRTVHGVKRWQFVDLMDVRFETTRTENSNGVTESVKLFLMSKDPQIPPQRIPVFLNNRPILERAIHAWRSAINLAENPSPRH
jgi:hypothetical protein